MTDIELHLDFCGARMRVCADKDAFIKPFQKAFPDFIAAGPFEQHVFKLTIEETDTPAIPHDLPLTYDGPMADGQIGKIFESESISIMEIEDGGFVLIDHAARTAHARLRPDTTRFFGSPMMTVIDSALMSAGQQMVHAASLVDEISGKAILFCVPSGGGKTTTSLALAHGGFRLMTDDASVLIPTASGFAVWGMPRALKVHFKTAELLPWVGPLEDKWDENGEQGVKIKDLADRISVAAASPVELGAIVLIGPRSPAGHSVAPVAKPELLVALAHDNVAWRQAGMTPKALRTYATFSRAVASVPTFKLSAGTDLASLPSVLREALQHLAEKA
jgi:hypothetical protein